MTRSIVVSPLKSIGEMAARHHARFMISLMSADHPFARPGIISSDRHLSLQMNDITFSGTGALIAPEASHVAEIIRFNRIWNGDGPLLIHCWMGVSRSPAAALIAALSLAPDMNDDTLAACLRSASPYATPNTRLIALGDEALERGGSLVNAVENIGRGANCSENLPFELKF
ncbi:tyrosine phosphatase family protein [Martelella mediterranea]|uniref:Tyrosine specific protein phosphatases domain-containing protein n=1 Tax=Martelella mediterranea TaxID=293089 RepID=A0A4R3NHA6_9HYPH|nr:protein tyrosine phosphatase [Martelella mediterranea]TCT31455.1 putative protein tyrosine phosphatase [Martelella mediterranea]